MISPGPTRGGSSVGPRVLYEGGGRGFRGFGPQTGTGPGVPYDDYDESYMTRFVTNIKSIRN